MPEESRQLLHTRIESPIGELLLLGDGRALHGLYMLDGQHRFRVRPNLVHAPQAFVEAERQLREYFAGERRRFELLLELRGSPFQLAVWRELQEIGYGETISYGELASRVGDPSRARAVGSANGRNPISVIVPCHRVIGGDGSLVGYGGGLERKRILLELEANGVTPQLLPRMLA
jgi:methylated-DNA-[protein]-cysteine S-methyltransferase